MQKYGKICSSKGAGYGKGEAKPPMPIPASGALTTRLLRAQTSLKMAPEPFAPAGSIDANNSGIVHTPR
jgi:hypothetical protein